MGGFRIVFLSSVALLLALIVSACGRSSRGPVRPAQMSVLTYNVYGPEIIAGERVERLYRTIESLDPDIIALQETSGWFISGLLKRGWIKRSFYCMMVPEDQCPLGQVLTLSRFPIRRITYHPLPSNYHRRFAVTEVEINGQPVLVVNVHLESPLEDGPRRIEQLQEIYRTVGGFTDVILTGDFNFGDGDTPESAHLDRAYQDIWTILHPDLPGYTWDRENNALAERNSFPGEASRRLDRVLVKSPRWVPGEAFLVGTVPFRVGAKLLHPSDHYGVFAKFTLMLPK